MKQHSRDACAAEFFFCLSPHKHQHWLHLLSPKLYLRGRHRCCSYSIANEPFTRRSSSWDWWLVIRLVARDPWEQSNFFFLLSAGEAAQCLCNPALSVFGSRRGSSARACVFVACVSLQAKINLVWLIYRSTSSSQQHYLSMYAEGTHLMCR